MKHLALIFLSLFSFSALCNEKDYSIDRINWQKLLNKNTQVIVENLYGNILVKKSYSNSFVIHAVNQNHNSRDRKAKFIIEENGNSLTIKLSFQNDKTINLERSDLSLAMPKNMPLKIIMNDGKLTAKKIMNPLTVKSESTDIFITTKSQFNVFSKTGDIFVKILEKSKPQQSSIQSHKGDIELEYLVDKPYFEVLSGNTVVSNSARLLMTKKKNNRKFQFNESQSLTKISIINDIGHVILIDKNMNDEKFE